MNHHTLMLHVVVLFPELVAFVQELVLFLVAVVMDELHMHEHEEVLYEMVVTVMHLHE